MKEYNMEDPRQDGDLIFMFGDGTHDKIQVLWQKRLGDITDGKTWRVSISFTKDWKLPRKADDLVTRYLFDPIATLKFLINNEVSIQCSILFDDLDEQEDFRTWGVLTIGSTDLGRAFFSK
jgi:hypothetical protein